MAENQSHEKINWHNPAAQEQAEVLMKHRGDWGQAKRGRQLEAVLVELAKMYPQDKENIIAALHGGTAQKKQTPKKKMVEVSESIPQMVKTGCDDCGESDYRAKKLTELESADEVLTYFNAAANEASALRGMNIFLRENGENEVKTAKTAAKKVLELIQSDKRILF